MSRKMQIEAVHKYREGGKAHYAFSRNGKIETVLQQAFQRAAVPSPILTHTRVTPAPLAPVETTGRPLSYYAIPRDGDLERILDSVFETLTAKNEVGELLSDVKDVVTFIVPVLEPIDALTDEITDLIDGQAEEFPSTQITNEVLTMDWIAARLHEKSFWRGIIAFLGAIGVAISPALATAIIFTVVALVGAVDVYSRTELRQTVRGGIMIATALGVAIAPDMKELIITGAVALAGLAEGFFEEKTKLT